VPALFLGTAFGIAFAYRAARLTVFEDAGRTVNRFGELAELLLYVAILAHALLAYRRHRAAERSVGSESAPGSPA